jgi:CheY-like chemotaxis protein
VHVLLADDSVHARRMGEQYLADLGCSVEAVADGASALAALERRTPDLVLVDAALPGLSGIEFCRRVKAGAASAATPVLILTGALSPPTPDALAAADGVLRKPLSSAGLEAWLRRAPAAAGPVAAEAPGVTAALTPAAMLERAVQAAVNGEADQP